MYHGWGRIIADGWLASTAQDECPPAELRRSVQGGQAETPSRNSRSFFVPTAILHPVVFDCCGSLPRFHRNAGESTKTGKRHAGRKGRAMICRRKTHLLRQLAYYANASRAWGSNQDQPFRSPRPFVVVGGADRRPEGRCGGAGAGPCRYPLLDGPIANEIISEKHEKSLFVALKHRSVRVSLQSGQTGRFAAHTRKCRCGALPRGCCCLTQHTTARTTDGRV